MSRQDKRIGKTGVGWVLPFSIVMLVVVLLSLVPWLLLDPAMGTLRHSNGTSNQVLAVTFGSQHSWRRGSLAAPFLELFHDREGNVIDSPSPGPVHWDSGSICLAVWKENQILVLDELLRDDHGCVFDTETGDHSPPDPTNQMPPAVFNYHPAIFWNYPRNSELLSIGETNWDGGTAWLQFASPVDAAEPTFSGEPLPRRGKAGILEVAVKGVKAVGEADPRQRVEVEIRENGASSKKWRIVRYFAQDATGNVWGEHVPFDADPGAIELKNLCRSEAWRIRFELLPVAHSEQPADEVLTLKGVPYPGRGQVADYSTAISRKDWTVAVRRVAWYRALGEFPRAPCAFVSVKTQGDLALAAFDEEDSRQRSEATPVDDTWVTPDGARNRTAAAWVMRDGEYPFALPPRWRGRKDLVLKLYRPRKIEVTFQP